MLPAAYSTPRQHFKVSLAIDDDQHRGHSTLSDDSSLPSFPCLTLPHLASMHIQFSNCHIRTEKSFLNRSPSAFKITQEPNSSVRCYIICGGAGISPTITRSRCHSDKPFDGVARHLPNDFQRTRTIRFLSLPKSSPEVRCAKLVARAMQLLIKPIESIVSTAALGRNH